MQKLATAKTLKIDYTCEHDDAPRALYLVAMHDGSKAVCSYCEDCAGLARADWNGETKSCVAIDEVIAEHLAAEVMS